MQRRTKILIGFGFVFLSLIVWGISSHYAAKARLRRNRAQLIAAGEKLTIAELIPPSPTNGPNGARDLISAATQLSGISGLAHAPTGMKYVKPGVARVVWRERTPVELHVKTNLWPALRQKFADRSDALELLMQSLQSSNIFFDLPYEQAQNLTLPHLSKIKSAELSLAFSTLVSLHDGKTNIAYDFLKAAIVLPETYKEEPIIYSQVIRSACASIAFSTTWEAWQQNAWSDEQWASLQKIWEEMEFLRQTGKAMEMERAFGISFFQQFQNDYHILDAPSSMPPPTNLVSEVVYYSKGVIESPRSGIRDIAQRYPIYWCWRLWWRYDDEIKFNAISQQVLDGVQHLQQSGSWSELFRGLEIEAINPEFTLSQILIPATQRFLSRMATAEVQLRLAATAIALKRFHMRNGTYPQNLAQLVPEFIITIPKDLDAKPLRYQFVSNERFLLYSIGTDLKDDGGDPRSLDESVISNLRFHEGRDLLWPAAATPEEVQTLK